MIYLEYDTHYHDIKNEKNHNLMSNLDGNSGLGKMPRNYFLMTTIFNVNMTEVTFSLDLLYLTK